MAKTLAQIQKQIDTLQREAQVLRAKEVSGVVARIQEAIDHYQLTADDLFGGKKAATKSRKTPAAKKAGKARAAKAGAPKPASKPKFRDEAGHTWSGIGKRPNWFKDALAAGKTPDELMIKA